GQASSIADSDCRSLRLSSVACCLSPSASLYLFSFFFNDPATTEIYTLSLHDALPIYVEAIDPGRVRIRYALKPEFMHPGRAVQRSEEHTSELQSPDHLVCRLLLEKKKNTNKIITRYD